MSKIGRKPINISGVQVEIKEQQVHYKGSKSTGTYQVPAELSVRLEDGVLLLGINADNTKKVRDINRIWGLHRSLLANDIQGASKEFERQIKITGLGFKGVLSSGKVLFSLGYSHKIDFVIPKGVSIDIDKTGQLLTVRSADRELTGLVVSNIEKLRPTEPYKGTGIKEATKFVFRKPGKAKSSS